MASNSSGDAIMGANDTQRPPLPQFAALDYLIPGFSVFSTAIQAYLGVDLNVYIPVLLLISGLTVAWTYFSDYVWGMVEKYLMSVVRIRTDDEIYNMIMTWVAAQKFAQGSRNFIVNTNINSRSWFLWRYQDDDEESEETEEGSDIGQPKKKPLQYTPSFGSHFFWYNGSFLLFERHENREQSGFLVVSEREEISISCFGRNPRILKELLIDARAQYMKKDESKTLIYRAAAASNQGGDPSWQRCMSRSSRPFSTVILNEKTKSSLIEDVTDYLNPATRRWYANRGIPYRRGYLLYGPPGTGKSSLSLALAGFFRMRIYMVSLSSPMANEENLATLFAELPRRCVVLLEDIDSAGLTHSREVSKNGTSPQEEVQEAAAAVAPGKPVVPVGAPRLSLSGLLNILDGVASQEGRILIMTTNHLEKLDKALIRPGRVDMTVSFGLADADMTAAIFRAIYAPYDGEAPVGCGIKRSKTDLMLIDEDKVRAEEEAEAKARTATIERVDTLSKQFAAKIPELEFSPAELQGLLLKHKRDPETVLEVADQWVIDTRKEKKVKEIEDAEDRRKEEEKRKKEEAKKKRKEEKAKAKKRKEKAKKRANGEDSGSESDSESESDSAAESETKDKENKENKDVADDKEKDEKDSKSESDKKDSDVVAVETEKAETKEGATEKGAATENENENEPQSEKKNDTLEVKKPESKGSSDSGYDTPDAK